MGEIQPSGGEGEFLPMPIGGIGGEGERGRGGVGGYRLQRR